MTATVKLTRDLVRAMPKVELHVHVESCISAATIEELANRFGVPMLRPRDELFSYSSLTEFLRVYEWWCALLRTEDIAEEVAYRAAKQMSADGIVYADVLTGPRYWTYLDYSPLVEALGRGFERAHAEGFTDCRLVPSISREQSSEWAMDLVEWIATTKPERVVGLGLDGNEAVLGRTSHKFEKVFERAHEIGLGRAAHCGESGGPESVWDGINHLHLDRIDHGVRAIEDPVLVKRLAKDRTTLTVCPTSNVIVGLYASTAEGPLGRFIESGVPVTVNSDDPQAMDVSINDEFLRVGEDLDWTLADAIAVTRTAIDTAFCGKHDKQALHRRLDGFVAEVEAA